ncbi:formate/nitrite transporter family protein [Schnuerera sp. xch1]|uniref:formate/nitrite transporter family protein n=1 Tax=Schnuerera sp. xch1 TaxID=2874283 RepID=UPI001CC0C60A|nr:formate/nitrite transporter family protein [Schnuerera sp. xch1]MBZ2175519.1 formate/nitrite transporter family protein [Schnuerera sp. xch1]
MKKRFLAPSEVAESTIISAETKANLSTTRLLLLGIMAGIHIGYGAFAYIIVSQSLGSIDAGLAKFLGASVFPVGLMLVIFTGSELFTGNNLMTMAIMDKKITIKGLFKNWFFVYLGNFIGSILLAYTISKTQLVNKNILDFTLNTGLAKTSLSFQATFLRGILCNILVVLGVWSSAAAQDIVSRIFAIWFPIMLFVVSGYEYSIANMFFIPFAKFMGLSITWVDIWISNLIPVTLGNILGGGIIVPIVYYIAYILPAQK